MNANKVRKKCVILFCLIVILSVFVFLFLYGRMNDRAGVKIERERSWFDEFYIKDDRVYIRCYVTMQNSGNEDKYVKLEANMEEDADKKLIRNAKVTGYDEKGVDEFLVPANSTEEYTIYFIDDFAGNNVKQDRNLPEIDIVEYK